MLVARRIANHLVVLALCNAVLLWQLPLGGFGFKLLGTVLAAVLFVYINIAPCKGRGMLPKQRQLAAGCELLFTGAVCSLLQLVLGLAVGFAVPQRFGLWVWLFNSVLGLALTYLLVLNGSLRLFATSAQLQATRRVLVIWLCWWPVVNLANFFIAWPVCHLEAQTIGMRAQRNHQRRAQQVCATRYPLLLVHGIFFRDWKQLNYWGRIPGELAENGAVVYYGQQQSSASVAASAEELKAQMLHILQETGSEKMHIIAHSKGGLDARYAISLLGMDAYVASLTTVNTPHQGCRFARKALDNVPEGAVSLVSNSYNKLFSKLGDDQPDFFSGVSELTDEACAALNAQMPDKPGVLYQSIGSKMATAGSAPFPLNLGFTIVQAVDGENDGLVDVASMPWGPFTMLEPAGKTGISHADVIDLFRRDIKGFDAGELYVGLVAKLKAQGL